MGKSIHQIEWAERRGRIFPALVVVLIIGLVGATWVGLFGFLGANQVASGVEAFDAGFVPAVGPNDIDDFQNLSQLSQLYSADGVLLAELSERLSDPVPLEQIPDPVIHAILASEDGDFYQHSGVDFQGTMRAAISVIRGSDSGGGSTITQQVVRQQQYVGRERTVLRKIAEARYAAELERQYSKDTILEFYLNSVYYGWNAYGIKAAAREYFGKDLNELTIAEAAAIGTTIRNPSLYDMRNRPEEVVARRNIVLDLMVKEGFITQEVAEREKRQPLEPIPHQTFQEPAPQIRIAAVRQLLNDDEFAFLGSTPEKREIAIFGCPADDVQCEDESGLKGGLRIWTTVDFAEQTRANELLRAWLPQPDDGTTAPTGAIVTVDNRTGAIKVMAGGLDFGTDFEAGQRDYNLATEGQRQPGSSFKPFTLIAYLEQGGSMNSYWNWTHPQEIQCDVPCGPGGSFVWKVGNASGGGEGVRSLFSATVGSVNTVFANVAVEVGPAAIKEVAHRMGVRSDIPEVYSLSLGAGEVSPLDMASAYSTLANYGVHIEPYVVSRIEDSDGNLLYEHRSAPERVLDEAIAATVVEAMQTVVSSGTGTRAQIGRPQAGKTGTNQEFRDAWFVGFVPQYSTAVWVGYADEQRSMREITINGEYYRRVFGGSVPAPIWRQFMEEFLAGVPVQDFPPLPPEASRYKVTPSTTVPEITPDMNEKKARQEIYNAHLAVQVEEVNSIEPAGTVLGVLPTPGVAMPHGGTVTLQISNGLPPTIPLPRLAGLTLNQARQVLLQVGAEAQIPLSLGPAQFVETANSSDWDRVLGTNPPAGSQVDGQRLIIPIVGRPPSSFLPPPPGD